MHTLIMRFIRLLQSVDPTFEVSPLSRQSRAFVVNREMVEVSPYICRNGYLMVDVEGYVHEWLVSWQGCEPSDRELWRVILEGRDIY